MTKEVSVSKQERQFIIEKYKEADEQSKEAVIDEIMEFLPIPRREIYRLLLKAKVGNKPVTGSNFLYGTPEKMQMRKFLYTFIAERIPEEERLTKKIICLCGVDGGELQGYIDLGFKKENIYAVEIEDEGPSGKAFKRTTKLPEFQGVQFFNQDIYEVIKTTKTKFDIVSLDFTGFYSYKKFRILEELPTSDNAIISVNLLNCRGSTTTNLLYEQWIQRGKRTKKPEESIAEAQQTHREDIMHVTNKEKREDALKQEILYRIGKQHQFESSAAFAKMQPLLSYAMQQYSKTDQKKFHKLRLMKHYNNVIGDLHQFLGVIIPKLVTLMMQDDAKDVIENNWLILINDALFQQQYMLAEKTYTYASPVNGTPFIMHCYHLKRPEYTNAQEVLQFFMTIVNNELRLFQAEQKEKGKSKKSYHVLHGSFDFILSKQRIIGYSQGIPIYKTEHNNIGYISNTGVKLAAIEVSKLYDTMSTLLQNKLEYTMLQEHSTNM